MFRISRLIPFVALAGYAVFCIIKKYKKPKLCDTCKHCTAIRSTREYSSKYKCSHLCTIGDHDYVPKFCDAYENRENIQSFTWRSIEKDPPKYGDRIIAISMYDNYVTSIKYYGSDSCADYDYWIPAPEVEYATK